MSILCLNENLNSYFYLPPKKLFDHIYAAFATEYSSSLGLEFIGDAADNAFDKWLAFGETIAELRYSWTRFRLGLA